MMKFFDFLLTLLIPSLILIHLLIAPYTKVEESFNLQATHDILVYSTPTQKISARLRSSYDHFEFPGAVPRTFVGAAVLAGISRPILQVVGWQYGQLVVRAVLGLFNAFTLLRYKSGVEKAFGKEVGRWYVLLQASQFHVIYYASRTLPNMFAFGLSTLAFRELLPMPPPSSTRRKDPFTRRHSLAIYLLVLAGTIFRSELALLLTTQLIYMLLQPLISLQTVIPTGLYSAIIALAISIPIDSYFWQRPIWPELAGFFYNAVQGKSAEWGISPFHAYFTSFLSKLLLNPLIPLLLIPSALYYSATRPSARALIIPSLAFIAIYSIQPHKEARFIIYVVPPLTACAALGANCIFTRRSRSLITHILSSLIILSIVGSFIVSTIMLGISSLNYPGGEALFELHQIVAGSDGGTSNEHLKTPVNVHMDVLSCMTGVSRFQQDFPTPPFSHYVSSIFTYLDSSNPFGLNNTANHTSPLSTLTKSYQYRYDKTEEPALTLLDPAFWAGFDYVLTESPETIIGKWNVVHTVYGYAGIEILRPGAASRSALDDGQEVGKVWEEMGGEVVALANDDQKKSDVGSGDGSGSRDGEIISTTEKTKREIFQDEVERLGIYAALREGTRRWITKGWWVGPRMEAKIRILKRAPP